MKPGQLFNVNCDHTPVWNTLAHTGDLYELSGVVHKNTAGIVIQSHQKSDGQGYMFVFVGGMLGYVSAWYVGET
jgi:hypothetical protein